MSRHDAILAALAASPGAEFTPVQVQKLFFLIDERASHLFGGKLFDFEPYHYGPFDRSVYDELESLELRGFVRISRGRWNTYTLTDQGLSEGKRALEAKPVSLRKFLSDLSAWVRGLSFRDLVAAIYDAYPDMKKNSVFQG